MKHLFICISLFIGSASILQAQISTSCADNQPNQNLPETIDRLVGTFVGNASMSGYRNTYLGEIATSGLRLSNLTAFSPTTYSTDQFLTVNEKGDIVKARYQLRINNVSEWSDNVFTSTYQLRPLAMIAAYIGQHGHLPDVPSAEEIAKNGVDLVKMNAKLLEKIEELTLYSIELKKTDQAKQRQLDQQQVRLTELERLTRQALKRNNH